MAVKGRVAVPRVPGGSSLGLAGTFAIGVVVMQSKSLTVGFWKAR